MRHATSCPACAARVVWRIDPVRERDLGEAIMAVWFSGAGQRVGHFELYVCATCGACEWWAAGLGDAASPPGDPEARLFESELPACDACEAVRIWQVPMLDIASGGGPSPMVVVARNTRDAGRLLAWICAACGHTRWRALDLEGVVDAIEVRPSPRPCPCGSPATYTAPSPDATVFGRAVPGGVQRSLRWEQRSVAARTGFWGLEWRGKLELQLCTSCGRVDWHATKLEQLREDPTHGVTRLDGELARRGPYR